MHQHYKLSSHILAISCSQTDPVVYCYSYNTNANAMQVIQQLQASKDKSSSSKLEKLKAMMVDVSNLMSKPFSSIVFYLPDAMPSVGQDKFALAKEGLHKIFDWSLEALADDQVQKVFLTYSAIVLSVDSCPSELKADLSSFRGKLLEETSDFLQAQNDLKVFYDLSVSITQKKIVLRQQTYKYAEARKEFLASEDKISNLKASLATEESYKAKIVEILDSIETQITSARDGLVSDFTHKSAMEETIQAANQLVSQQQSVWNSLRTTFIKFA